VNGLAFLSPGAAREGDGFAPLQASPLARALAGSTQLRDLSLLGKIELRGGDPPDGVDAIRITPHRVLVVCEPERCAELLEAESGLAIDMTGALAGIELDGEVLMRRLTDLDLSQLPAAGKVAGVPALVSRSGGERYRIFFAQEVGHSVVETVRDLQDGLA
jgi:hypothetical protein